MHRCVRPRQSRKSAPHNHRPRRWKCKADARACKMRGRTSTASHFHTRIILNAIVAWAKEEDTFMFSFETADQKEVRRFRIAQFNGRTATVKSDGSTVTGHVRSVLESKSSIPQRWTITIVPAAPKPTSRGRPRPAFAHSWKTSTERPRSSEPPRCPASPALPKSPIEDKMRQANDRAPGASARRAMPVGVNQMEALRNLRFAIRSERIRR